MERTFASFEDYWSIGQKSSTVGAALRGMTPGDTEKLKQRVRDRLQAGAGPLTLSGRANAIKGVKPR